jgi:NADH:ubiquinone oxidoreductase subunit E
MLEDIKEARRAASLHLDGTEVFQLLECYTSAELLPSGSHWLQVCFQTDYARKGVWSSHSRHQPEAAAVNDQTAKSREPTPEKFTDCDMVTLITKVQQT